jgi:carbonic anhydrase
MCELCRQNKFHLFGPSRRSLLFGVASSMGLLLANAAGAKEMKTPPKPQNVVSPAASLERSVEGQCALRRGRVAASRFQA